jgi:hypothetical protein
MTARLAAALRRHAEEVRCLTDGTPSPERQADLYGQVLAPIADRYYSACRSLAKLAVSDATHASRVWKLARLATLQECGDLLAGALEVAAPEWEAMRHLADPAVAS